MSADCIDPGLSGNKPQGYHQIRVRGRLRYMHRIAYADHHNLDEVTLPLIRHLCHNPRCVNPLHLATGTHQDNANDRVAAGRSGKTRKHKLTHEQKAIIKMRFKKNSRKHGAEALAREFGVSCHPIHDVVRGVR